MIRLRLLFFFLALWGLPSFVYAQTRAQVNGVVQDAQTGKGIPFASVRMLPGNTGTVADLAGNFTLSISGNIRSLEVSSIGYQTKTLPFSGKEAPLLLRLQPAKEAELAEVKIGSPMKKIRRLLNAALAHRDRHNPEKHPEYQCSVYYKMIADMNMAGLAGQDSALQKKIEHFQQTQHLLIAETYSRRSHRRPASLQEDILATRVSGLSSPAFTNLITDVLPFQIQSDFIKLGQMDYPNPVAKGYESRYYFCLVEELQNGNDTVWIIQYRPRKNVRGLQGQISLNSDGYVVSQMIAEARDTALNQSTRIDIQYAQNNGQWFPEKLNYRMEWRNFGGQAQDISISGNSRIDSVSFALPKGFRFDKAHTARLTPDAVKNNDSDWHPIRPEPLSAKDTQTYHVIDSFSNSLPTDNIVRFASALPQGKFPVGKFDVNLTRVYSYNAFEGTRLGLGLQTSDKITKRGTAGLWGGYGLKDKRWKYGGFAELFFDDFQEQVLRISYDRDLRDPGRVYLDKTLESDYIRQYLIQRADLSEKATLQLRNRMGYLSTETEFSLEKTRPLYAYRFLPFADSNVAIRSQEITLRTRYAFGEKRAYSFGTYLPIDTRYPILYMNLTGGRLKPEKADGTTGVENRYLQLTGGIEFRKHLNRLGMERILLMGGKSFSDAPLPLSRLFAARGYRLDYFAAFTFGNFYTLRPYDLYNDIFVSLHFRHHFDFHFFKTTFSYPSLSVGYNGIWGQLGHAQLHQYVQLRDASQGYHEAGLALHDLLRYRVMGLAYINLHAGYYAPLQGRDFYKNGCAVLGLDLGL